MTVRSVLHALAPAKFGGLESVVRALADAQRDRGYTVRVVATLAEPAAGHPFIEALREKEIEVIPLSLPGRAYQHEWRAIGRLCAELRPDIVHTHGYRADVIAASAARARRVATASTVHGFTGGDVRNRLYEWIQERALRRSDIVVAVAKSIEHRLLAAGVSSRRTRVVPNAYVPLATPLPRLAARDALGIPPDAYSIGWVGRLSHEKGPDIFLDALARVPADGARADIIGAGPMAAALQRVAPRSPGPRVIWHGHRPDAGRYFSAFDAFVLSSRTEGLPVTLLEAMAAGVPIIAARAGGVPEALSPAEALLVPVGEPGALAAAIEDVRRNPIAAAQRVERAGTRLRDSFGPPAWLDAYDAAYSAALGRERADTPAIRSP